MKMKILNSALITIIVLLAQQTLAAPAIATEGGGSGADLMNCVDNYSSSFVAHSDQGKVVLHFAALGYADRLEIAEKLGLPKEGAYSVLEFSVPEKDCSWAAEGRLSCHGYSPTLLFKNKKGDVETLTAFKFSVATGEVGAGSGSYRRVELAIEKDNNTATNNKGYQFCSGVLAR
jgi:hypothetical protein